MDYRDSLELFLQPYSHECHQIIGVCNNPDIQTLGREVGNRFGLTLTDTQREVISNQEFLEINQQINLIPFKINSYPVVIVVKTENDVIHQIDISNILNIATIHSWYQVQTVAGK